MFDDGTVTSPALLDDLRSQIDRMQGRPSVVSMALHPALAGLIQVQPGRSYAVDATSLALLLMAGPSAQGAWCAIVGSDRIGLEAAAALGIDLDRTIWVPDAGSDPVSVLGALVDAVGVVMVDQMVLSEREAGRLKARLQQRQAVLVAVGDWPRADARLRLRDQRWEGPQGGHGHLQARQVTVEVEQRGQVTGSRRLWFPNVEMDVLPVATGVSWAERPSQRAQAAS